MHLKEGRYYIKSKSEKKWTLQHKESIITGEYITFDELLKKHPNSEYTVIGEVLCNYDITKKQIKNVDIDDTCSVRVNPVGTYSKGYYKNIGYIPCKNEEYIALYAKNTKKFLLPLILFLALILSIIFGVFYINKLQSEQEKNQQANLQIDSSIVDYRGDLKRPADMEKTQILIPGITSLVVEQGTKNVITPIFNPNDNPCFFQFNLIDKTTGETVYSSKLIPPGKGLKTFEINKLYPVGEHGIIVQVNTHDLEEPTMKYNGSEIEAVIIVE